jgi:hypothetical protein
LLDLYPLLRRLQRDFLGLDRVWTCNSNPDISFLDKKFGSSLTFHSVEIIKCFLSVVLSHWFGTPLIKLRPAMERVSVFFNLSRRVDVSSFSATFQFF